LKHVGRQEQNTTKNNKTERKRKHRTNNIAQIEQARTIE